MAVRPKERTQHAVVWLKRLSFGAKLAQHFPRLFRPLRAARCEPLQNRAFRLEKNAFFGYGG
jgi:hypothetical protein